jgi:hypothetical protein
MMRYLSVLVTLAVLAAVATSGAAPRAGSDDVAQIYGLQSAFLRAAATKDLDLMMSLWTDGATLSVPGTQGYEGKSQIRGWYAAYAPAFRPENHWVPLMAPGSTRIDVRGNQAALYFEVHYVDVRTRALAADAAVDATLARVNGRWLIQDVIFGPASL